MASQNTIEKELARAGVPRAPEVAERLDQDMAREFSDLGAGQPDSVGVDGALACERIRRGRADKNAETPLATRQRLQSMLNARIVEILNQSLAGCMHLRMQCQQARWNMVASDMPQLSYLFEDIDRAIAIHADELAKRIVSLGGRPDGSLIAMLDRSGLSAYPATSDRWQIHADGVVSALTIIRDALNDDTALLDKIDDTDSATLLCAIRRTTENYLGYLPAPRVERELSS